MINLIILDKKKNKFNHRNSTSIIEKDLEIIRSEKLKEKLLAGNNSNTYYKEEIESKILFSIIKNIFYISDKYSIINLINSIYNDGWDTNNTEVIIAPKDKKQKNVEVAYDMMFILENEYQKVRYKLVIKAKDHNNTAIIIFKEISDKSSKNIISFFANRDDKDKKEKRTINDNPYIILFCANMPVPDVLEVSLTNDDRDFLHKFNVLKGWKYDFKKLYENGLYILFPLKIFDLEKRIENMLNDGVSYENINYEICRFFRTINNYLRKLKEDNSISDKSIYYINMMCFELLNNINNNLDTEEIKIKIFEEIKYFIG